jgi:hypothetical protein
MAPAAIAWSQVFNHDPSGHDIERDIHQRAQVVLFARCRHRFSRVHDPVEF